ncbi:mediator of RNA polymerase II transcription subunit 30-like isoform X4 [Zootermopsis nevadensis]|uniref:mediator of RNA polymerase II transcription subunit 30-like isoform X3 n=1 Tax=Zootermopsis nevadensis TaxID=136037 RepID=UPI000B8E2DD3|nr:mediator of RNA polymerase II transcription subunit 30-like isoform X3 [Zootermopsis nevadensis]XP_021914993.1 mediator of RNA polymerase II transcription subunit 30-like isoform X3 [Zootermopsis nevadensis]XP_021914994.1 mediator of RNA polymerase II transcription subunit 30-like isoform X3 [Zootermopsis nevadensis]XP_021914995.1 mediator of RNA polymerase II transcription subunit 30-like isoform X4 [Zootermopsis nevadensis]
MAGPQHSFPSGFSNAQQGAMRNQFGGLVNQQPYGVGIQASTQQALSQQQQNQQLQMQQQQIQQQLQQQQMQQLQQQQQQQQAANQNNTQQQQGNQPQQNPSQQQPPNKEFNTASLCRFGQETVQDIVSRTQEVFQALKAIQPPNGTAQGANTSNEKKSKVHEQLKTIRILFKRLRLIYEKCNENCQGMEYTHIESLIPLKEEWDMKSDEKKTSESYRLVCEENKEIMEQVILKNRHLKEIIDHLRRIIWEINTMLTMRRS